MTEADKFIFFSVVLLGVIAWFYSQYLSAKHQRIAAKKNKKRSNYVQRTIQ